MRLLVLGILLATYVASANAAGCRLFPFGRTSFDADLGATDEGSVVYNLTTAFRFYGRSYTKVRIYSNGYLSMGTATIGGRIPVAFPARASAPMIAPYWADVDTRRGTGRTYYRETTERAVLFAVRQLILSTYRVSVTPTKALIVTWNRVGYYGGPTSRVNTFQSVLATTGTVSYVIFLYENIQWTTSRGRIARCGLNAGDGRNYVVFPGSGTSQIVHIKSRTNAEIPGVFLFRCDGTTMIPPPQPPPPPPAAMYPFGSRVGDSVLPAGDNRYAYIRLRTPLKLYTTTSYYPTIYENGYLSVYRSRSPYSVYNPISFPSRTRKIIVAPFMADADSSLVYSSVFYRETTDATLLRRANTDVARVYGGGFTATSLLIATWHHVGYYRLHDDKHNTFQCILASNGRQTFVMFAYSELEWTTGDRSRGSNGFGGYVAKAGINAGDGVNAVNVSTSGIQSEVLRLNSTSNCGVPGLFVLQASIGAELYPFGGARNSNLGDTDDRSATVPFIARFYGVTERTATISNNGYIILGKHTGEFTPQPFPINNNAMIAPFWADVDTRAGSGRTYYRVSTDASLRARVKFEVESTLRTVFNPTSLLIATWYQVGYYTKHVDKLNTFQAVIATDGTKSYVIFIYKDIRWTTGDASGGRNGFGGTVARAGINAGSGTRYVNIPGSGIQGYMLVFESRSNVRIPGMFILGIHPAAISAIQESGTVMEEKPENSQIVEAEAKEEGMTTEDVLVQELESITEAMETEELPMETEELPMETEELPMEEADNPEKLELIQQQDEWDYEEPTENEGEAPEKLELIQQQDELDYEEPTESEGEAPENPDYETLGEPVEDMLTKDLEITDVDSAGKAEDNGWPSDAEKFTEKEMYEKKMMTDPEEVEEGLEDNVMDPLVNMN